MHRGQPEGRPLLLVATAGGHLAQLQWLRPRLRPGGDAPVVWASSRGPQFDELTRSGDRAIETRSIPPRDVLGALRTVPLAVRACRAVRPSAVVSTGSAVALAFLPVAALLGIPAIYIESATRDEGPSLTGRILRWVPGVRLACQSPRWANQRWRYVGSVLDGFARETIDAEVQIRNVVVTVGTMERYGFRRLIERAAAVVPRDAHVLWQTGSTDVSGLGISGRASVPSEEMRAAISDADVVIAHAGTGTALTALELGRQPVLVPRSRAHGEHVDDHQEQTAARLSSLGLAQATSVAELDESVLVESARHRIVRRDDAPEIDLLA